MDPNNKILIITYAFPPVSGGGVQRTVKYIKYLRKMGCESVVVTYDSENPDFVDERLLKEAGDCKVSRVSSALLVKPDRSFSGRIKNRIYRGFQAFYTSDIGWVPKAVEECLKLVEQEKPSVIYATGNPFGTFLIGKKVSIATGIPLVVDYRDSWSYSEFDWEGGKISRFFSARHEKEVLKHAAHVLVAKPKIYDQIQSLYPPVKEKMTLITNGFDEEDFNNIKSVSTESDKFRICFTGGMWKSAGLHSPLTFLSVLKSLFESGVLKRDEILFEICGDVDPYYENMFEQLGVMDFVKLRGFVSHDDAVRAQVESDLLLLLIESEKGYEDSLRYNGIIPAKIFEYVRSGTPILGIVPEGGFEADLIKSTQTGLVAKPNDEDDVREKLLKLVKGGFKMSPDENLINTYSREALTEKFLSVLRKVRK